MADIKLIAVFGYLRSTISSCSTFGNVVDTSGQFAESVVDTGGNLPPCSVVDTGGAPWLADISANKKKIEMTLKLFSRDWGKMIHEKNLEQEKACDFVP